MSRRIPIFGFILALLCMGLALAASAGDAFPGKLFYAKKGDSFGKPGNGSHWRSEISFAAPIDTALDFKLGGCIVVGPSPCENMHIAKGGAKVLGSSFAENFAGPDIGVIDVPLGVWSASSFLEFSDGTSRTAFTAPALRWVLDNPLDDYRAATAARTADKTTCSTFFVDASVGTAIQVRSYGADGERATSEDGYFAPTDVYFLSPHSAAQGCLADWYAQDGKTLIAKGPKFDAGSVRLSFGCGGVGPCPGPQRTWFIVTKGPPSGATVEMLPVQELGAVEGTSASVLAEATASLGNARDALIRLHGPAPASIVEAVDRHNADVERMRAAAR